MTLSNLAFAEDTVTVEPVVLTGSKCTSGWMCASADELGQMSTPVKESLDTWLLEKRPDPLSDPDYGVCVKKGQDCAEYARAVLARCHATFGPAAGHCRVVATEAQIACNEGKAPVCP